MTSSTNRVPAAGSVIAALALAVGAVSMATSGDLFRSALLGIAALLVLNVLLWAVLQVWPTPEPEPAVRPFHLEDVPTATMDDSQSLLLALGREEGA
ncbi:MAG: hypothetical protein U0556_17295 [Dehalococcoidia bacterium]